jgi:4-hydroxybenzoate polyprenyltransferase
MEAVTTKTLIGMAVLSVVLSFVGHLVSRLPIISISSLLVAATLFYSMITLLAIRYRNSKRDQILP